MIADEKKELVGNLADATKEAISLRDEINEANKKNEDLNSINSKLQEDMNCAREEDAKSRHLIHQKEETHEVFSQELESASGSNFVDLQKRNEDSHLLVGTENNTEIRKLTEELESTRESLRSIELERNMFQVENQSLTNRINMLVKNDVTVIDDTDVADDLRNTRERLVEELKIALKLSKRREDEIQQLENKVVELEEHLGLMEEGNTNKEEIISSLEGELQQWKQRAGQ